MKGMVGPKGFALALTLIGVGLSACAERGRPAPAEGRLAVSQGEFDFKRVGLHSIRKQQLILTNVGRGGIVVEDAWVEGPKGNFLARFLHSGPHSLLTEESCELEVRFSPKEVGERAGFVVIRTDNPRERIVRLPLRGEGVDSLVALGTHVLDFGRIEAQSEKRLTLPVENTSDLVVTVTPRWLGEDRDEFSHEGGAPFTLAPGEARELPVFFRPQRVGVKRIALAVSPCEGCPEALVDVRAEALDRAIVALPPSLDFGGVPMDRDLTKKLTLTNISTEPGEVRSLTVSMETDPSFSFGVFPMPLMLGPGESRELEVRFSPGHTGESLGRVTFEVVSVRNPILEVGIRGVGGATELCVAPHAYDFGTQPVGAKETGKVVLKNCGSPEQGDLTLRGVGIDPASRQGPANFSAGGVALPARLAPGEELTVDVYFEPTGAGPASAELAVDTDAFQAPGTAVLLQGEGRLTLPCRVAITPELVDFGNVPPGDGRVLGIKIHNVGTDLCPVKNVRISDTGRDTFFFPGTPVQGVVMGPGTAFSFMVGFIAPVTGGTYSGAVQVDVADPAAPVRTVPLLAHSQESCLVANPNYVDFGYARLDCPADEQEVNYLNACATELTVTEIRIGAGTSDGEFVITSAPITPRQVGPGEGFSVRIDYLAAEPGMNLSPLYVATSELPRPLMVTLLGESSYEIEELDHFVQQDGKMVDVLFVVDNTASMVEEQPKLSSAMPAFAEAALQRGVDLHVAVTTTGITPANDQCPGGAQGGEAGRLFPADNSAARILTDRTSNLGAALQRNVNVGLCAYVEQGLEAARRALSEPLVDSGDDPRTSLPNDGNGGFLRDAAALAVVFVGDEDDNSPDSVDTYVRALQTLKGQQQPQRMSIYAIAPSASTCSSAGGAGVRYEQAAQRTGGDVLSVCASDYAPLLRNVANKAFAPQDRFPLSATPESGSVAVEVDGSPTSSGWRYDSASNSIVFSSVPSPGTNIDVTYRRSCGG